MALLDPAATTVGDLCLAALRECGALGIGQTALADDLNDAWARLQWMLQQWERKRWLVYHLVDMWVKSTGVQSYTVGPGGDFETNPGQLPHSTALSVRPARLESAFLRQPAGPVVEYLLDDEGNVLFSDDEEPLTVDGSGDAVVGNQIDYPLQILQSREDYNRIALKSLTSFSRVIFLDTSWPMGRVYVWPIPNANIYEIHITAMAQLPYKFATVNTVFELPYESFAAILYNLALRLRPKYRIPTFPGDPLQGLAKDSLNVLRGANLQIAQLVIPVGRMRGSRYNIFSDQFY